MTTLAPVRDDVIALGEQTTAYARGVVNGSIVAGQLVRLACERHLRDLDAGHLRGLRFDSGVAGKAIKFFGALRHYKGEWAGQPLALQPWQMFIIGAVFGWLREDDSRRFRVAYNEIPRKNGKSLMAAGVGLLLAFFDGEGGAEVYSAATKRDQAKIVWGDAKTMVKASPDLQRRIHITGGETGVGTLSRLDNASKFVPLGADGDTMDGLNIHGAIIDELHAHKTRVVWDVIQTGTGARRQPLTFVITTAGFDRNSVCYEQHDYGIKVLQGVIEDDTFFCYIACWDSEDDWTSPESWEKANPNYGISVKIDDLERKCAKAQQVPAEQNEFLRKHGNVWTQQATRWLTAELWEQGSVPPADLKSKPCYAGIHAHNDMSAIVLWFPDDDGGGDAVPYFFMPAEKTAELQAQENAPYVSWADGDFIEATSGNVTDYDLLVKRLSDLNETYEVREVAIHSYLRSNLETHLMDAGFTVVPITSGFAHMSAPTLELERLLIAHKARHAGNPVLRWMAGNIAVRTDSEGHKRPDDEASGGRIGGMRALIMAIGRSMVAEEEGVVEVFWMND